MIGRLQGKLLEKQPPHLVLDINGVGYDVMAPMTTFYQLPALTVEVVLHTHFSVSETSQQLFGFISKSDRSLFRLLIKVNGVGPKMALGIMSGMDASEFVACVRDNNVSALVKVPGVGKKTAERLVIDLRDRLAEWQPIEGAVTPEASVEPATVLTNAILSDAESALVALGYKPVEASKAVAKVLKSNDVSSSEELIRLTLRNMMP